MCLLVEKKDKIIKAISNTKETKQICFPYGNGEASNEDNINNLQRGWRMGLGEMTFQKDRAMEFWGIHL